MIGSGPRAQAVSLALLVVALSWSGCAAILFAGKVAKTAALLETVVDAARTVARQDDDALRIAAGQVMAGHLHSSSPVFDDGSHYDTWLYSGHQGETLQIDLESETFDAYLIFGRLAEGPQGSFEHIASDDDSGEGTNARIVVTLPAPGTYAIFANAYEPGTTGAYSLSAMSIQAGEAAPAGAALPSAVPSLRRF